VVAVLVVIRFNSGSAEDSGVVLFSVVFTHVSRRYPQIGLVVCNLSFSYMVLTNLIMPLFSEIIFRSDFERFGSMRMKASTLEIIWE